MAVAVELKNITKSFGTVKVLENISLKVQEGEFLVLVGPSGCGKSTLLRTIAGLETPNSGEIFIHEKNVSRVEPQNRDIAMVFQSYALYPHMTVYENIAFALKLRKFSDQKIKQRIHETAELLQIVHLLERQPRELSGGQRQRVALGRALARRAPVILFDEPLSNLDAHLRQQMRIEIKKLHQHLKNTMIYVTHDQIEATTMGDRIAVINRGKIEQLATPKGIYNYPANRFVAGFIGSPEINLIDGQLSQNVWKNAQGWKLDGLQTSVSGSHDVLLGVRPEDIRLNTNDPQVGSASIEMIENLGAHHLIHLRHGEISLRALSNNKENFTIGEVVKVGFDLTRIGLFDKTSQVNLMTEGPTS